MTATTIRSASVGLLALAYTGLTFGAALTPAPALAADGPYYRAELAQPVEPTTEIIRGTVWQCNGTTCVAAKSTSRPVVECQRLAKKVGSVSRFVIEGVEIEADKLAKCQG